MSKKQLIVFDFDWSFVDQDTDRWVFEVLSTKLRRLLQSRKSSETGIQCTPDVVWVRSHPPVAYPALTDNRDQTMEDLSKAGFTREDVLGALRILPFVSPVYY